MPTERQLRVRGVQFRPNEPVKLTSGAICFCENKGGLSAPLAAYRHGVRPHQPFTALRIYSTSDVSLSTLAEFNAELPRALQGRVESSQAFFRSVEPPSWIALLANADWWTKVFAAWLALYLAEITKEAGKETWRNRTSLLAAVRRASDTLRSPFARSIETLRARLSSRTEVRLGLPVPSNYFSTTLDLGGSTAQELESDLLVFLVHLPALVDLINTRRIATDAAAGVALAIRDDCSLEVSWQRASDLRLETVVLQLPDHAV